MVSNQNTLQNIILPNGGLISRSSLKTNQTKALTAMQSSSLAVLSELFSHNQFDGVFEGREEQSSRPVVTFL